ncbi:ROK family transcriptional regulator [Micromonospora sp. WMMA1923]|uniref:ROK family transcriptional regulator n=1 Tax=Micromonospora sp. WMMA1923 TaxID=3404125 RepID=UPI003B95A499
MISVHNEPQPTELGDVRMANRAVVLRHVRVHAPCSRADIAAHTGLNKATVSSLVTELIEGRLVRETGLTEHRIGRPATMLVLDGEPYAALGMEIGGDELTVVAIDLAGTRLLTWRRAFAAPAAAPGDTVRALAALARRALNRVTGQGRTVLGLTVGVPGLVDAAGRVELSTALRWRGVDLAGELRAALGDPEYVVGVDNEANLAALAEHRHGAYAGTGHLVHLTGGTGVGAGIICAGRLLRGGRGLAGELGHLPLAAEGPWCACGRSGCVEAWVGLPAVIARVLPDSVADGPVTDFLPELDRVETLARQGDPAVLAQLAGIGRHLGHAVSMVANLVDPEVVVVGGHFATLGAWLLPTARQELADRAVGGCRLAASVLGAQATALGGATAALAAIESGRLPAR